MALYSRSRPEQARAADEIEALLLAYPYIRQVEGITVWELMRDHPNRLKSAIGVLAAIGLLTEERRVRREMFPGQQNCLEMIRVYPLG